MTLNSGGCRANMSTTTARTMGEINCVIGTYIMVNAGHFKFVLY